MYILCHIDQINTFESTQSYDDDGNINVDGDDHIECNSHKRLQMIINDDAGDDPDLWL